MKKPLSLILSAIMVLLAAMSLAETAEVTPLFSVDVALPEGYEHAEEFWIEPTVVYLLLESTDEDRPMIDIRISSEEMTGGVTFTRDTWDSDAVQNLASALSYDAETEQYDAYDTRETADGNVVMIIHEVDYTRVLTLRYGYMLTIFVSDRSNDGASLPAGNETLDMIMKFISDMKIFQVSAVSGN
ncbi:MAG: hypothetical protein IKI84_13005 [Clostridia bacterium]|nr:hypothetical protein [Clostridia bacterium]